MKHRLVPAVVSSLVLVAASLAASLAVLPAAGAATKAACTTKPSATVQYRKLGGVPKDLTSLDVHTDKGLCAAPVVVWVHGGGYHQGDKTGAMADKVRLAREQGWVLVSVNYRLTRAGATWSAHYPDHYDDVAHALAWVRDHIDEYGGDPDRIALLGHSAGADIVANVVTQPSYLAAVGMEPADLACFGPLDTEGFDKTQAGPLEQRQWQDSLGNAPDYRTDTSATLLAQADAGIPPVIGVARGTPGRRAIETAFLARLADLGVPATTIDAAGISHGQVSQSIGAPGDTVMTPPLVAFLDDCFS
ncbi:MAG: alpha/beta hydrolase [Acidimicrobiia bacterium]